MAAARAFRRARVAARRLRAVAASPAPRRVVQPAAVKQPAAAVQQAVTAAAAQPAPPPAAPQRPTRHPRPPRPRRAETRATTGPAREPGRREAAQSGSLSRAALRRRGTQTVGAWRRRREAARRRAQCAARRRRARLAAPAALRPFPAGAGSSSCDARRFGRHTRARVRTEAGGAGGERRVAARRASRGAHLAWAARLNEQRGLTQLLRERLPRRRQRLGRHGVSGGLQRRSRRGGVRSRRSSCGFLLATQAHGVVLHGALDAQLRAAPRAAVVLRAAAARELGGGDGTRRGGCLAPG